MKGTAVERKEQVIVIVCCPRCGSRYFQHILPPFCMLAFCEHPFGTKAEVTLEQEHINDPKNFAPTRYWS